MASLERSIDRSSSMRALAGPLKHDQVQEGQARECRRGYRSTAGRQNTACKEAKWMGMSEGDDTGPHRTLTTRVRMTHGGARNIAGQSATWQTRSGASGNFVRRRDLNEHLAGHFSHRRDTSTC